VDALARALAATEERVAALLEAVTLTESRYAGHTSNYLEVLDAQRDLFEAQLARVRTQRELEAAYVRLYRALGGGWTSGSGCPPPGSDG
jgi:multidrug efflux system outer membrane protein